jgi:predicted aspartyl protease
MMARIFTVAAVLGLAACDEGQTADYRPEEVGTVDHALCLLGFIAIPLRTVRTGHHLVEARINKVRGSFVLDTGANVTVVDVAQVDRLGIDPSDDGRFGLGATVRAPPGTRAGLARIDSLEIGPVMIRQKRVVTADIAELLGPLGTAAGAAVAGIVGQDVLTEHRAVIDVQRSMLYLMAPDRAPAPVPEERCRPTGE